MCFLLFLCMWPDYISLLFFFFSSLECVWDFPGGPVVKNLPAMQETWVWSLGWEDSLEEGMATHSSTLAWRIPWTEEPDRLQSMGLHRVGHDWSNLAAACICGLSCDTWADITRAACKPRLKIMGSVFCTIFPLTVNWKLEQFSFNLIMTVS